MNVEARGHAAWSFVNRGKSSV